MKAIVTGAAGFIGFATTKELLRQGFEVVGVDNLNDYYSVELKKARLKNIGDDSAFRFVKADIANKEQVERALGHEKNVDVIVHLAAQAGVRYSIENPSAYVNANVEGEVRIFEQALKFDSRPPVVYASSSSVYGANKKVPFSEDDRVDDPVSVYAATKRAGELLARSYHHVHKLKTSGLRFFTVYGPWGRPDMAPWLFTDAILNGRPIKLFNYGKMQRDFTFIDDIVYGVVTVVKNIINEPENVADIYNLGNNKPVQLLEFVEAIERATGKKALTELCPMPPADVKKTYADISRAERDLNFHPTMSITEGMVKFVDWFKSYQGK